MTNGPTAGSARWSWLAEKLAREWNGQHRAAHRSSTENPGRPDHERGLANLSALLLLSDKEYVSLDESEDPEALCPEDVSDGDQPAILRAVKSNLFADRAEGCFVPVHRQVAEFLAARFLHGRVASEPGVTCKPHLCTHDGGRRSRRDTASGLCPPGWRPSTRTPGTHLIETDPVGTTLYGDVSAFHRDEFEELLQCAGRAP